MQDVGISTFGMVCPAFPDVLEGDALERLVDWIRPQFCEYVWSEPYNERDNWENVRDGYQAGGSEHEWFTDVFGSGNKERWSAYALELYQRLRMKAERDGWLSKLRFLLYEHNIVSECVPGFGDLSGIILQSKPGADGLSKNVAFARLQRELRAKAVE